MILLDTSAVIELLDSTAQGIKVAEHMREEAGAISVITVNELLLAINQASRNQVFDFMKRTHILTFDKKTAVRSADLELDLIRKGKQLSKADAFIAATALENSIPLLSCDADFERIPNLKLIKI